MKEVITVYNMRASDAYTIAMYVPGKELMWRAAMGVYRAVQWRGSVGILAGSGNNGGDGYALACILRDNGIPCKVWRVAETFSEDGLHYYNKAVDQGVDIDMYTEDTDLADYDMLVDCILGTGFHGKVEGLHRAAIKAVNNSKAYVVSVDINSGMNGDTGHAELAVKSDLTVTIGYLKSGFFLGDSIWYVGKLVIADIGIRLLSDDYYLAKEEEIVFPNTGLDLHGDRVELLTPGEAEDQCKNGQTVPEFAIEEALKTQKIIRVIGSKPLVTDGYRTYFVEVGEYPGTIECLGQ